MKKCGALWRRKAKDGRDFLAGVLNGKEIPKIDDDISIMFFKNDRKETEKQPDYFLFLSEPREKKEERQLKEDNPEDVPF